MIYVLYREGLVYMKNKVMVELQHDFPHVYYYFVIECLSFEGKMNVLDTVLFGCVRNWVRTGHISFGYMSLPHI
jgi:hypothetical protein